ncbi:tRNA-uridine aminocarboxypropyltransferase [Ferrimonas lipolytica]|uniref:tRNA-uridine aminocarboxypropyltransferase n=1 Tax=Ferrimonas lipolytica TaxID=2724191 RepID=A0A6H1UH64_9GAMM|nr:tRNA-uridine aminocarboxypropyltransferase [Ferrimonas lipolytica]QIZ78384.1 DTW domain-containing protein [Ferrimonas lipolytica]
MLQPNNAVLELRQQRLAVSTRPFNARGATVERCPRCQVAKTHCCCQWARPQQSKIRFCLLMHPKEPLKPTNTGRIIAEILPSTSAFCWQRVEPDPAFLALIQDPTLQPFIVFPGQYSEPERVCEQVEIAAGKTPLLILLDGTWKQARKMFQSNYLNDLPVLSINPEQLSRYKLRSAAHDHQLATAEVAAQVLAVAGEPYNAQVLDAYFQVFSQRYNAGKMKKLAVSDSEPFQFLQQVNAEL